MMSGGGAPPRGMLLSGRFPELEDALCERVAELRAGGRLDPLTVVVGSAALRTRVGDLLVRRLGAVANVRVVTLARLAVGLAVQPGGGPPAMVSGSARERLVRRLVAERASAGLRYFGPVAERPHFAQALAATFADLREARVEPGLPWARVAAGPSDRAADLEALYRAYCDELGARALMDGAGVHLAAAAAVSARPVPGHVVIYGVHDLNQAQESLVGALAEAGADVLVPLPREAASPSAAALDVARAAGLTGRRLEPPAVAADRERLAVVWRSRDAAPVRLSLSGDGTLAVVSVPDERAEVREAARVVVSAAAAGAAFWECAVVVPHGDDLERVASGLAAAGLPVACRRPDRSTGSRVLRRLGECLAPPAGPPFSRRAVVDLLSAAPVRGVQAPPGSSALWLDEARQAGVVSGPDQWAERIGRRRRGLEKRVESLESRREGLPADEEDVETLQTVQRRLAAARSLETAVRTLSKACRDVPERAPWDTWAHALGTAAERLFEPPAGEAARDAAARLSALGVVGEEVDLAEAVAVLREQLAAARVPVGRVGREGVAVLTPLEVRGLEFHTIAFTGLAEGGFPARGRPDPLLGDPERRRLAERFGSRLPLAEQRDAESLLLFAFAGEAARGQLTLLAPRTDAASGRPRLPSRLLLRFASLAAGHPVTVDEFVGGTPLAPVWRRVGGAPPYESGVVWVDGYERDTAALLALSENGRSPASPGYLREVLADSTAVERRLGAWRASRSPAPGAWDGLLGGDARAALAARHPFAAEMHPTRLERYIGCPFAFLLRDVLGLDAPDEPGDALEIDPLAFGTLAHEILERAFAALIDASEERGAEAEAGARCVGVGEAGAAATLELDAALAAVTAVWEASCADAERRGVTGAALSWGVRRGMLLDDLLECVRRDPVFTRHDGRPVAVEWSFGEGADRPVALELSSGQRVRFAGRLDRIDATSSGARVVDYKTGAGNAERARVKDGLSVQLPVYQLAVRQAGAEDYDEIRSLYRLVTRRGGFDDVPLPTDEASACARLRDLVAGAAALVDAGMFPRTTRGRCDYCDVRYACGVSAWARARKREHEALEPVIRLQDPADKGAGDGG